MIHDVMQGSPEWFALRRGKPTASQFGRIITPKTGKLSAAADEYIAELIGEQMSLVPPADPIINAAMRHGIDCEAEARHFYAMERDVGVQRVGFITSECGRFGSSPDFLVSADGCGELKCPQAKTQVLYLIEGVLPAEYKPQCHGHLVVSGRKYCDFLSYHPGLPSLLVRVEADEFTDKLRACLELFHARFLEIQKKIGGAR